MVHINEEEFLELYSKGLTDEQIAEKMGLTRITVLRTRNRKGLKPNRTPGQRGPGKWTRNESYLNYINRVLNYIAPHLRQAARNIKDPSVTAETKFLALVMYPGHLNHPNLLSHVARPERMTYSQAIKIVCAQRRHEMAGMAGVPGPDAIELAQVCKSASPHYIQQLAEKAVISAGFVSTTATVAEILQGHRKPIPYKKLKDEWKREDRRIKRWLKRDLPRKLKKESRKAARDAQIQPQMEEPKKAFFKPYSSPIHTGKKGKGGGIKNIEVAKACLAIKGY